MISRGLFITILSLLASSLWAAELPTSPQDEAASALAKEVEEAVATGSSVYTLKARDGGGTSVYPQVQRDGKTIGAIIPEDTATIIVGEVSTYQLGRALGCGSLFQPAFKVSLRGQGLATFRRMLETNSYRGAREENRRTVLARIQKNPEALPCVFKVWAPGRPLEYEPIHAKGSPNGHLNRSDVVARFLRAGSPQPGTSSITIRNQSAPANLLAADLSNIFLVDALAGQWDRFSGGNLHLATRDGQVRFSAQDNGGASIAGSTRYLDLFKTWVTRFDPATVDRLLQLDALLHENKPFAGFNSAHEFGEAIGLESAKQEAALARRVAAVAAHVRSCTRTEDGFIK